MRLFLVFWHRQGKGGHLLSAVAGDFCNAFLFDFVNSNDRVHGDEGPLNAFEFIPELIFRWINQHLRVVSENVVFNLNKAIKVALIYVFRVDFKNLALIVKKDLVSVFFVRF